MERVWYQHYERGVAHDVAHQPIALADLLAERARTFPKKVATRFPLSYMLGDRLTIGGTLTYAELDAHVNRFANALLKMGVKAGDRVALVLPNSPQFVIAFFGAMRIGAIVVNNNPTYTATELKHQFVDSGAETVVLLNLFVPRVREIQAQTSVKRLIVVHIFDLLPMPAALLVKAKQKRDAAWVDVTSDASTFMLSDLLAESPAASPGIKVDPSATALLQYTGGTTGIPKAAMLTHNNLIINAAQARAWIPGCKQGEERMMCAAPFFHVYGMTVCMIVGIYMAAELVITPNPRPISGVMKIIAKERCTIFPGVPAMYIGIINNSDVKSFDLTSIKVCISGSAPLPMEVQERFGEITGGRLVEGFGMTECSPVSHANPINGLRKPGSIGIPIPGTDARLIDLETGAPLPIPSDREGELCVRGPQVMQGYWNQPDETAQTVDADGWLRTGDIARVDADGYFSIVDRKKDMIIASGLKVLPREVEEVLFTHDAIVEAVICGIPNAARGDDMVKAYIVLKEGASVTPAAIRSFCAERLAPHKVPREVEFRTELPKTLVGKVLRRALIEEEQRKRAAQV